MCSSYALYTLARCILRTWSTKLFQTNNDYLYILLLLLLCIHKNISSTWSYDFFFLDKIRTSDDAQYFNVQGLHFLSWCNQLILLFFVEYLYVK